MIDFIKVLIVICGAAGVVYVVMRPVGKAIGDESLIKDFLAYFVVAQVLFFLSPHYNIFIALFAVFLFYVLKQHKEQIPAAALILLICLPTDGLEINTYGLINRLFEINQRRLVEIFLLLPAIVMYFQNKKSFTIKQHKMDKFIYLYIVLDLISQKSVDPTATHFMRVFLIDILEVYAPYFVFSRLFSREIDLDRFVVSYIFLGATLGLLGFVETAKNWILWTEKAESYGIDVWNAYRERREGHIRTGTVFLNALAFGCFLAVALSYALRLKQILKTNVYLAYIPFLMVFLGLMATYARGQILAAVAGMAMFLVIRPGTAKGIYFLTVGGFAFLVVYIVFGGVDLIRDVLYEIPFLTATNIDTIEYRLRLIESSVSIIGENYFSGLTMDQLFIKMGDMIQGQGIVDLVNVSIQYGVLKGMAMMFLFMFIFMFTLRNIHYGIYYARFAYPDSTMSDVGRVLAAVQFVLLVSFHTTSMISHMQVMFFIQVGVASAYYGLVSRQFRAYLERRNAPRDDDAAPEPEAEEAGPRNDPPPVRAKGPAFIARRPPRRR